MLKLKRLAPLVAVLALAGCGGHSAGQIPAKVNAPAHGCSPSDYAMQCALATQPAPTQTFALTPPVARGIDFGWNCPSSRGFQFGESYLSTDSSKNWTRACVARWPHRGLVWETSATRALSGFANGQADARQAGAQARALGAPANVHIDFAIDFDATPAQQAAIDSYFEGADSVLGVSRVGDYGGYWPTIRLCAAHLATRNWQTYAWSAGKWASASCAPLEQYQNSAAVDYDRAIAPDYGQWPYTPPKPKPPKPKPSYRENFQGGFQRGFVVAWDRRRHRAIPVRTFAATNRVAYNTGFQAGFGAGWKASR